MAKRSSLREFQQNLARRLAEASTADRRGLLGFQAGSESWLIDLAEYLRKRAATQLPNGERLELTIVDVDRAGDFEPWLGMRHQDTRIVRDIYPPRMTLQVKHFDASGTLVSEGERKLSDPAFLLGTNPINSSDPLRFEKRMIDSWLRRELNTASR